MTGRQIVGALALGLCGWAIVGLVVWRAVMR
jgi:hypothetical protein